MSQIYLIIVDKEVFHGTDTNTFCTKDKAIVHKCLNAGDGSIKSRVWLFPEMKEISSADITLTTE